MPDALGDAAGRGKVLLFRGDGRLARVEEEQMTRVTPLEREAIENFINYLRTLPRLAAYGISWSEWDANARFRFEHPCDWHMFFDLQPVKLLSLNFDEIASYFIKRLDEYSVTDQGIETQWRKV